MKHLLRLFLFLALLTNAAAYTIHVAWGPSTGTNIIVAYRIYLAGGSSTYALYGTTTGTSLDMLINNLMPGVAYTLYATALDNSNQESLASNFVSTNQPVVGGLTTLSVTNNGIVTIPSVGPAVPYPSGINVVGMKGVIVSCTVTLRGFTHTWPGDVDMLVVSPTGQKVLVFSDAVGGHPFNNVTLTFSDSASSLLPVSSTVSSGTYKPTNYDTNTDKFPLPAPSAPFATTLSAFNGQSPNGVWSLYVQDDGAGDLGKLAGWSITLNTK